MQFEIDFQLQGGKKGGKILGGAIKEGKRDYGTDGKRRNKRKISHFMVFRLFRLFPSVP
jgi:hypothetical protein